MFNASASTPAGAHMRRHSSGFLDDSAYYSGGGGGAAKFERKSPYHAAMMTKREIQPSPLSAAMRYVVYALVGRSRPNLIQYLMTYELFLGLQI